MDQSVASRPALSTPERMASEALVGNWTLVSYELLKAGRRVHYPFGPRPRGYLMYSPDGLMSVAVMPHHDSPAFRHANQRVDPFALRSWLSLRGLQRLVRYARSVTRYISYSGRYTVVHDTVIHHVDVSSMPGLINTNQERAFEIKSGLLILTAEIGETRQRFVWKRFAAD